jgi:hypothetical protein
MNHIGPIKLICIVVALVFFAIAGYGGVWPAENPWWRRCIAIGLFFATLGVLFS